MELICRNVLKLAAGGIGLNLNPLMWHHAMGDEKAGLTAARIKSCIVIFYYGGPSHLVMFDTKPDAPTNIRGEFKPISTSVPGLQVSELLPAHAKSCIRLPLFGACITQIACTTRRQLNH